MYRVERHGPNILDTVSNLIHLQSLTLIGIVIPSMCTLRSLVSISVEELCLIDTEFASREACRNDGHETRVQSFTRKGKIRAIEYEFVMALCPALANTALYSIDVTLYSRRHILQMQEQLSKGVLRNVTVLHVPRNTHSMFQCLMSLLVRLRIPSGSQSSPDLAHLPPALHFCAAIGPS